MSVEFDVADNKCWGEFDIFNVCWNCFCLLDERVKSLNDSQRNNDILNTRSISFIFPCRTWSVTHHWLFTGKQRTQITLRQWMYWTEVLKCQLISLWYFTFSSKWKVYCMFIIGMISPRYENKSPVLLVDTEGHLYSLLLLAVLLFLLSQVHFCYSNLRGGYWLCIY